ncbi:MAG: hypothetical protein H6Q52_454 [Deltaproteobacteria bacterium]|nr:hypothetical protein [Deltaproteobacteria bacterium]
MARSLKKSYHCMYEFLYLITGKKAIVVVYN